MRPQTGRTEDVTQNELVDALDAVLSELIAYRRRHRHGEPTPDR
jgi:hypothetical protein